MPHVTDLRNQNAPHDHFATTQWSMVIAAGEQQSAAAHTALATLCENYWYPIYAFVRRNGFDTHEAQDVTQDFFSRLLEKEILQAADPERGRFRSFLLASVSNFLANYRDRLRAQKRGGGRSPLSLDMVLAEQRYACEPAHQETPEKLFHRRWGVTVLERALQRLRDDYQQNERSVLFDRLKPSLVGEKSVEQNRYQDIAVELQMSESAVKVAAHRMRKRFREFLQDEISQTLASPADIDDEIRSLFTALQS